MDLSKLSLQELRELASQVDAAIKGRQQQEVKDAVQKIQEIAQSVGLPLQQLLGKPAAFKKTAPVQYRHPEEQHQQWSGRGRQPKWVKEWIEAGKSMDDLRVART